MRCLDFILFPRVLLFNSEINPQFSVFSIGFHGVVPTNFSSPSFAQRMANVQDQEAIQIVDAEVQRVLVLKILKMYSYLSLAV